MTSLALMIDAGEKLGEKLRHGIADVLVNVLLSRVIDSGIIERYICRAFVTVCGLSSVSFIGPS
ncbi:MAG: hypothetical protein DRO12_05410 [Thermoprotei archaeon]|nr:MAG: hypothetical protein DRO12_05410 [Thermoprotei archaeon]